MLKSISISATKFKNCIGEIIEKTRYTQQPFVITKLNKPAVVILGYDAYENLLKEKTTSKNS